MLIEISKKLVDKMYKWILKIPAFPYWILAFVAGLLATGYSIMFKWSELLLDKILAYNPYLFLIISPLGFFIAWFLVWRIAPYATGSGIPQVMTMLDKKEIATKQTFWSGMLGLKTTLIKILSSIICLTAGGAVGREGPTVQISASIFNSLGYKLRKMFHGLPGEALLVAGGSAGIAAAFNTPLGGIVYGIEELSKEHLNKLKTPLITAVIIAGVTSQWISGSYLYLGFPKLGEMSYSNIPWTILIGVIAGMGGALFGKLLYWGLKQRKRIKKPSHLAGFAIASGLVFALFIIFVDHRTLGSGKELMINLLFTQDHMSLSDIKLSMVRFIGPILTQISGAAGGIFAPSLATGGAIGSALSFFVSPEYHNLFVVLGMIAFLTGVIRVPFTCFVLVLEMTDRHSVIFLMMISALIANLAARIIDNKSFYEKVRDDYLTN